MPSNDPAIVAALINFLNAVLVLGIAGLCWKRRDMPAARFMFGMMIAILLWVSFGIPEALETSPERKLLWSAFQYLGITTTASWFLLFALEYVNLAVRIPRAAKLLLFVPSGLICILAFTNKFHHLVWTHVDMRQGNLMHYAHGPAYWFGLIGYSYLLFLVANILMAYAIHHLPHYYKKKGALLGISAFMPFLASIAYNMNWCPPGVDPTPVGLTIAGIGLYIGILHSHLLEIIPVARHLLVERMTEGMLVFDPRHRLVDFNAAASAMIGAPLHIGMTCSDLPHPWSGLHDSLEPGGETRTEHLVEGQRRCWYETGISPLHDIGQRNGGCLLLIRDITDRKLLEARLEALALHDALTGLYNRHYLDAAMARGIARSIRKAASLAVIMFDIDHFKAVNDKYGHQGGDAVLRELGSFLLAEVREEDFACRFGGEEFVVVLPGAGLEDAVARAEFWRRDFAKHGVPWSEGEIHVTLSGGVSAFPEHGMDPDQLLQAADEALYAAKRSGRNRVVCAPFPFKEASPPTAPALGEH